LELGDKLIESIPIIVNGFEVGSETSYYTKGGLYKIVEKYNKHMKLKTKTKIYDEESYIKLKNGRRYKNERNKVREL
jgi:hypothetical protein